MYLCSCCTYIWMYTPIFLINAGYLTKKIGLLPEFFDIIKMRIWLAKKQYELNSLKNDAQFSWTVNKIEYISKRASWSVGEREGRKEERQKQREMERGDENEKWKEVFYV